jgi:predicted N-formylglutamate amidohydrolase
MLQDDDPPAPLLDASEAPPVEVVNPDGRAPLLLLCEHAGNAIPRALGDLGLSAQERLRHIAWDPGAADVARGLSAALDATLILQPYSRLVIDCNRPRHAASLIPTISDGTPIPGNRALDARAIEQRWRDIHQPFHRVVAQALNRRSDRGLVTIHSFTPVLASAPQPRPMHAGLLYGADARLADCLLEALNALGESDKIARNQPYAVDGESDFAIPVHGLARGIPNLLIELRQDLLVDAAGRQVWIDRLAAALRHRAVTTLLKDAFL